MDLNDLRFFALIVEHGGFSAAERHAHITKSKLSRRISLLEAQLGVRLLQRTTRKLSLTEAGRVFHEHCAAMLLEADAARQAVEQLRSEPVGTVRLSCTTVMAQFFLTPLVADFIRRYPKVRVELDSTDRVVNLIEERFDIALRAGAPGPGDQGLVARPVATGRFILVASPAYLAGRPAIDHPEQLAQADTLGLLAHGAEQNWSLSADDGRSTKVSLRPRLLCADYAVQYQAVLGGIGVALLPQRACSGALRDGMLRRVALAWGTPEQAIHLVFVSRRGMLPSVRALIDYLVLHLPVVLSE